MASTRNTSKKKNLDPFDAIGEVLSDVQSSVEESQACAKELVQQRVGGRREKKNSSELALEVSEIDVNANQMLDVEEFKELLRAVDKNLSKFPATAQVAAQQGKYLSKLFAKGYVSGDSATGLKDFEDTTSAIGPFAYFHKGSLAYLGAGSAAFDIPILGAVTGRVAGIAWKVYETSAQLSWKNRALVALDWIRSDLFGRDSSLL